MSKANSKDFVVSNIKRGDKNPKKNDGSLRSRAFWDTNPQRVKQTAPESPELNPMLYSYEQMMEKGKRLGSIKHSKRGK